LLTDRRARLTALAARYLVPTIYELREFVSAGGLVSYGASQPDMYRQVAAYTARILRGAKPVELPVMQATGSS
jgi:putative tryptophan/tyrosine transport system substrate-binding protein